jgi:catechol-2,3-dioxygenase
LSRGKEGGIQEKRKIAKIFTLYKSFLESALGQGSANLGLLDQVAALTWVQEIISSPTLPNIFLKVGTGHTGIPQMIVLVPKTEEVKAKPSGYQLHHLALEVPENDFDTQHAALVAEGFSPRPDQHPVLASRTMYVDDPDGNEVEFICQIREE